MGQKKLMEHLFGMTPIASPLLPYAISICGLDEIADFVGSGISHTLSILDPGWPDPEIFGEFIGCRREMFRFDDVIDEGVPFTAPSEADMRRLLALGQRLQGGAVCRLLIHCHAGISRSTAAAATLLAQFHPGREDEAFGEVARVRPWSWPNSRMIEFADALLERGGDLVAAMRRHHGRMKEAWPDLTASMRQGPRSREYVLAGEGKLRRHSSPMDC
jgi:predicted protein tyrosine phosphatase